MDKIMSGGKIFVVGYDEYNLFCAFTTMEKADDYIQKKLFLHGHELGIFEFDLDEEIVLNDEQKRKFELRNNGFVISYNWVQCEFKSENVNYRIIDTKTNELHFKTYIEVIASDLEEALTIAKKKISEHYSDKENPIDDTSRGLRMYKVLDKDGFLSINYVRMVYDNNFNEPFFDDIEKANCVYLVCNNARHAIEEGSRILGEFKGGKLDYPKKCVFSQVD